MYIILLFGDQTKKISKGGAEKNPQTRDIRHKFCKLRHFSLRT